MNDTKFIQLRNAIVSITDTTGIYPAAIVKEGVEIPRDQYGDGWNDCALQYSSKLYKAIEKIEENNFNEDLELLLLAQMGWWDDESKSLNLNMNDTFYYASADYEEVSLEEIPEVARLFKSYGFAGLVYWVSNKRKEIPMIAHHAKMVEFVKNCKG